MASNRASALLSSMMSQSRDRQLEKEYKQLQMRLKEEEEGRKLKFAAEKEEDRLFGQIAQEAFGQGTYHEGKLNLPSDIMPFLSPTRQAINTRLNTPVDSPLFPQVPRMTPSRGKFGESLGGNVYNVPDVGMETPRRLASYGQQAYTGYQGELAKASGADESTQKIVSLGKPLKEALEFRGNILDREKTSVELEAKKREGQWAVEDRPERVRQLGAKTRTDEAGATLKESEVEELPTTIRRGRAEANRAEAEAIIKGEEAKLAPSLGRLKLRGLSADVTKKEWEASPGHLKLKDEILSLEKQLKQIDVNKAPDEAQRLKLEIRTKQEALKHQIRLNEVADEVQRLSNKFIETKDPSYLLSALLAQGHPDEVLHQLNEDLKTQNASLDKVAPIVASMNKTLDDLRQAMNGGDEETMKVLAGHYNLQSATLGRHLPNLPTRTVVAVGKQGNTARLSITAVPKPVADLYDAEMLHKIARSEAGPNLPMTPGSALFALINLEYGWVSNFDEKRRLVQQYNASVDAKEEAIQLFNQKEAAVGRVGQSRLEAPKDELNELAKSMFKKGYLSLSAEQQELVGVARKKLLKEKGERESGIRPSGIPYEGGVTFGIKK